MTVNNHILSIDLFQTVNSYTHIHHTHTLFSCHSENRLDGSTTDKRIHYAMVFDTFLYVSTEKLCASRVGFGFD